MQNDNLNPRHFVFLLASTRTNGNSEQLARHAAAHLPKDTKQTWVRLQDYDMPAFIDHRHEGDGSYAAPEGAAKDLLDLSLSATDVVFVTPLYWYSLPTLAKHYLDHWSGWMRVPGLQFREQMQGRRLWNITVTADQDQSFAQGLIDSLRHTAGYMQMAWQGSLIGYGNRPGDVMDDAASVERAQSYFAAA